MKIVNLIRKHWLIGTFLLCYFFVTAYKLVAFKTPFYNWDESIYAEVGREMVKSRSLIPLWQGQAWLDKPPLAPLAYGIVAAILPLKPEISTRLFNLVLTIVVLFFVYLIYLKASKDKVIAVTTVIITAFIPAFLQRSQVLNVDVYLILGWLGFILFFDRFWVSLFFLAIAVLSKSLVGFYPVAIFAGFYTFQLITKKISQKEYQKIIKRLTIQILILSLWYITMIVFNGSAFIHSHFIESHLRRVTASIESHFGKKTFYIDLFFEEFGIFSYLSIVGLTIVLFNYWKRKNTKEVLFNLFFIPWFVFLNLTKTKIAWYIYPIIPQFAYFVSFPLKIIKERKIFFYLGAIVIVTVIIYKNFSNNQFFKTNYSSEDQYYYLSLYARDTCDELSLLVDSDSRQTHDVLKKMNLLIASSEWWGNQPRIVFYFGKRVNFIYNKDIFLEKIKVVESNHCIVLEEKDMQQSINELGYRLEKKFDNLLLYKKS